MTRCLSKRRKPISENKLRNISLQKDSTSDYLFPTNHRIKSKQTDNHLAKGHFKYYFKFYQKIPVNVR